MATSKSSCKVPKTVSRKAAGKKRTYTKKTAANLNKTQAKAKQKKLKKSYKRAIVVANPCSKGDYMVAVNGKMPKKKKR